MVRRPGLRPARGLHNLAASDGLSGGRRLVAKRNGWALAGWCVVWCLVFWIGGLFIAGFMVGVMDPANSATAGEESGQLLSLPLLLVAIVVSTTL